MTRQLSLFALFVGLLVPSSLYAFDLQIAGGVKGGMNGTAVRGVPEGDPYEINGVTYQQYQGPDIYPMFGLGGGIGGFLELRGQDIVGLELGLHHSWDNGTGWEDKNDAGGGNIGRIYQEQRTRALHIPIILKASVPGFVRPTFGIGLEIVKQNDTEYSYRSGEFDVQSLNNRYTAITSTYTVLAFTFGLEIDLGEVRIPIELRGGYNVGFRKDLMERADASGSPNLPSFEYDGEYEGHLALYTGILYQFDLQL